jgi:Protein of unknown function (DUF3810)
MQPKSNIRIRFWALCITTIIVGAAMRWYRPLDNDIKNYTNSIYRPTSLIRAFCLRLLPFSLGDILYGSTAVGLLMVVVFAVKYLYKFEQNKYKLAVLLLRTCSLFPFVVLLFWSWSINYNRKPLAMSWRLPPAASRVQDSVNLVAFDSFLVANLNNSAPNYTALSFFDADTIARDNYCRADTFLKGFRGLLLIKKSLYQWLLERTGIEGYFNPWTGEGQVDEKLPSVLMPFVISHEMAHQASIAAEGDANLAAYVVATSSTNASFRYSAYFNLWLYVDGRLSRRDSVLANSFRNALNDLTKRHIDTVEAYEDNIDKGASRYSGAFYNEYLKANHQAQGIMSYRNVTSTAWAVELQRMKTGGFKATFH